MLVVMDPGSAAHHAAKGGALRSIRGTLPLSLTTKRSVRPDHLEHRFGADFEIVAATAGADDGAGHRGLVDAVVDQRFGDMDGADFAQGQPAIDLLAAGVLQLDDLRQ